MTRSNVKDGLANLSGILPVALAAGFDGLKISEIKSVPDEVLKNSINITSDNERLAKWQVFLC